MCDGWAFVLTHPTQMPYSMPFGRPTRRQALRTGHRPQTALASMSRTSGADREEQLRVHASTRRIVISAHRVSLPAAPSRSKLSASDDLAQP